MLSDFLRIRQRFHKNIIPHNDKDATCTPSVGLQDYIETIRKYSNDPEKYYGDIVNLMQRVNKMKTPFCDFRRGEGFCQLSFLIISS